LPALLRNEMTGVLTIYFGNSLPVEGWSEALGEAHVRRWPNFSAAADEANLARIWAGIHFRTAVVDARAAGNAISAYVTTHAAEAKEKRHNDQRLATALLKHGGDATKQHPSQGEGNRSDAWSILRFPP